MCVILCLFGGVILAAAYYKLIIQGILTETSIVTAVYLASYVIPPMLYDWRNFWAHPVDQLIGLIAYFLTIPMYQIVFQLFAYANLHDVSWGNRDTASHG